MVKDGADWHGFKQRNWKIETKFLKPFNRDVAPLIWTKIDIKREQVQKKANLSYYNINCVSGIQNGLKRG